MNPRTARMLGVAAAGLTLTLAAGHAYASPLAEDTTPGTARPDAGAPAQPDSAPQPGTEKIIGGKPAPQGAYPWMAHLTVRGPGGPLACGGSLISPDIVLTAAHCVIGATEVTARIGSVRYKDGVKRTGRVFKSGPGPEKGDWAIIRLDTPYQADSYALLPADNSRDKSASFVVMGWGATAQEGGTSQILRQVAVPLVPDVRCGPSALLEVCAGDLHEGGADACQGDSGGPLAVKSGRRWVVVGVTSWGKGCAKPNQPGHYAQLSAFLGPIKAAIKEVGGTAPGHDDGKAASDDARPDDARPDDGAPDAPGSGPADGRPGGGQGDKPADTAGSTPGGAPTGGGAAGNGGGGQAGNDGGAAGDGRPSGGAGDPPASDGGSAPTGEDSGDRPTPPDRAPDAHPAGGGA